MARKQNAVLVFLVLTTINAWLNLFCLKFPNSPCQWLLSRSILKEMWMPWWVQWAGCWSPWLNYTSTAGALERVHLQCHHSQSFAPHRSISPHTFGEQFLRCSQGPLKGELRKRRFTCWSYYSIHYWKWVLTSPTMLFNCLFLSSFLQFFLHVFQSSVIRCISIYNWYLFLMNWYLYKFPSLSLGISFLFQSMFCLILV